MSDGTGSSSYSYDGLGRLTSATQPNGTLYTLTSRSVGVTTTACSRSPRSLREPTWHPACTFLVMRGVVLASAVLLSACSSRLGVSASATPSPTAALTEPLDVASRTACATRVLTALASAINASDANALEALIGPSRTHGFEWVSISSSTEVGPAQHSNSPSEVAYSPDKARQMLLAHAEKGERWTIVSVHASDGPSWHGGIDASVELDRELPGREVLKTKGKTALSCVGSVIFVLSLARDA